MSQRGVEQALGKLVMDAEFRDAFFRDSAVAIRATGIELTAEERRALGPMTRVGPSCYPKVVERHARGPRAGRRRSRALRVTGLRPP
jgi:hypothetical protein